jgi:hypothetical protein
VDRLGELIGNFRKIIGQQLLSEPLYFSDSQEEMTTLWERFVAKSEQLGVPPGERGTEPGMKELCNRFFEPFKEPVVVQMGNSTAEEKSYASPYELLMAHIDKHFAGNAQSDSKLIRQLLEGKSLERLLSDRFQFSPKNPLKLKVTFLNDISQWKIFLLKAVQWSNVSLRKRQLDVATNSKIISSIKLRRSDIAAQLKECFSSFFGKLIAALEEPPLSEFLAVSDDTETFLPDKIFNDFFEEYLKQLRSSGGDLMEFLFTPPSRLMSVSEFVPYRVIFEDFALEAHLKLKDQNKGHIIFNTFQRDPIVAQVRDRLDGLVNDFRRDLGRHLFSADTPLREGVNPRKIIEEVAREVLEKTDENNPKDKVEKCRKAYSAALEEFQTGKPGAHIARKGVLELLPNPPETSSVTSQ